MHKTRSSLQVTMKMVAEEAGVSRSTVSRVLAHPDLVDPGTASKVEAVVKRLGYVRNQMATQLAARSSDTIGLLLRDTVTPAYALLYAHLLEAGHAHGLYLSTMSAGKLHLNRGEANRIERLMAQRPAGIIVSSGLIQSQDVLPFSSQVPTIVTPRIEKTELLHNIAYDDQAHGQMIAEAVYQAGHRKVAVVVTAASVSYMENMRAEAMIKTLEQHAVEVTRLSGKELINNYPKLSAKIKAGVKSKQFSAVMFPNDVRALKFLVAARQIGLRVPQDVGVTGLDGLGLGTQVADLVTVQVPVQAAAQATMALMSKLVASDSSALTPADLINHLTRIGLADAIQPSTAEATPAAPSQQLDDSNPLVADSATLHSPSLELADSSKLPLAGKSSSPLQNETGDPASPQEKNTGDSSYQAVPDVQTPLSFSPIRIKLRGKLIGSGTL